MDYKNRRVIVNFSIIEDSKVVVLVGFEVKG